MGLLRIRDARKDAGITQENLAQSLGINRATMSKYETGAIDPPASKLQCIAEALGVCVQDLIGDETEVTCMTYGQRIRAARKKAGMTQTELAKKLGIPYQSIGQWEKDRRKPKLETLQRIADALGVPILDLLGVDKGRDDADLKKKGAEEMTIDTAKVEILMAEQGLNQKELGERCGIPRQNISSIIRRGRAEPRTVGKLAGGLSVTVAEIVPTKEPKMMEALGKDAVGLVDSIEVQGTFNAQTFFDKRYNENLQVLGERSADKAMMLEQITELASIGVTNFFTGGAAGVDCWAALMVLALREKNPALRLHCVLPYKGQADGWSDSEREQYRAVLERADSVDHVSRDYYDGCMIDRNHRLVESASLLLAVYNGTRRSGTGATVNYARKLGRGIIVIDPLTRSVTHERGGV